MFMRGGISVKARQGAVMWCSLLVLATPFNASAEDDANARAIAVQLFDEAESLVASGKVAEACPKYSESYRLDPQLGALLHLAECYEKNHQLASAWGSFRDAEELAHKRGDPRAELARERSAQLEPKLSYLLVKVPPEAQVPGLVVSRGGAAVPKVLWGSRTAVDAGSYRLQAQAPGFEAWQKQVVVGDASVTEIVVPKLVAAPPSADPAAPPPPGQRSPGATRRTAAIAVGGLGLVGVGVGGFLGLSAQGSLSDSKELCNENNYCTPHGDELRQSAKSKALVATIVTGVGAAGIVTAAILWFTAPKSEKPDNLGNLQRRRWAVVPANEGWGLGMTHAF